MQTDEHDGQEQMDPKRKIYGVPKAADLLRISTTTLRRMIKSGEITAIRFSKKIVRISQYEIDRILRH